MRLLIPLSILVAAVAAGDTFKEVILDNFGDCRGACMIALFKAYKGDCGDPGSTSSTRCYCDHITDLIGSPSYSKCIAKCPGDLSDIDFAGWGNDSTDLCDHDYGSSATETTSTASTTESAATSTASDSAETPTPTDSAETSTASESAMIPSSTPAGSETPSATPDAASTIRSSRVALAVGALAFLGYAM